MSEINKYGSYKDGIGRCKYSQLGDSLDDEVSLSKVLQVFNQLKSYIKNIRGCWIDVGCGNGRVCKVFSHYFDKVIGLDLYETIDQRLVSDNFVLLREHFIDLKPLEDINLISFFYSFYLMEIYGYKQTLDKAKELISNNGYILIVNNLNNQLQRFSLPQLIKETNLLTIEKFNSGDAYEAYFLTRDKNESL